MLAKRITKELPTVVIVGRTNVGKSKLFNTLTEKKQAIVSGIAGTTRDANMAEVSWNNQTFTLIDTGGFMDLAFLSSDKAQAETIDEQVQAQARSFLTRADIILFIVDNKDGLLPADRLLAQALKKIVPEKNKLILVANKVDSGRYRGDASDFFKLNMGEPQLISAATGSGTGDLLDVVTNKLVAWQPKPKTETAAVIIEDKESAPEEKTDGSEIRVCIFGQPNVGKSSLLNAILGYQRVIVSPQAHTTREPQDTVLTYKKHKIRLVDTAGIHRQGLKTGKAKDLSERKLEHQGVASSLEVLSQADMAILVVDISQGLNKQDLRLAQEVLERSKSLIIVANKWDLVKERDTKEYTADIYRSLPFATYVPIQFTSAKTQEKVDKVLDFVLELAENRQLTIPQAELDDFISWCVRRHPPTKGKGQRYPKVKSFTQSNTNPPTFAVKVGAKEFLADSYLGFLTNRLREKYNLIGTPVKMWVEKANAIHGAHQE